MIQGVIYVATGKRFVEEAKISYLSLREQMPDVHVTLFTDNAEHVATSLFDSIQIIPNPKFSYIDKIYGIMNSPYEKTVFLDTDTFVATSFWELFDMLSRFDLASVRDHWGSSRGMGPESIDDFNTGVIVFAKNERTRQTFQNWLRIYEDGLRSAHPPCHDQPAFRISVYEQRDLNFYVLAKIYNLRLPFPAFIGMDFQPVILHGRRTNFARVVRQLNSSKGFRFMVPNLGHLAQLQISFVNFKTTWMMVGAIRFVQSILKLFVAIISRRRSKQKPVNSG